MDELTFLKLKVVNIEYQNMLLRLERTKTTLKVAYDNELRKFGLDPEFNYSLNDETHTAIPIVPASVTADPNLPIVDVPKEN